MLPIFGNSRYFFLSQKFHDDTQAAWLFLWRQQLLSAAKGTYFNPDGSADPSRCAQGDSM
jgi:hypothetical protein